MHRPSILIVAAVALVIATTTLVSAAVTGDGGEAVLGADEVSILDFAYDPATVTVKKGAKLAWTNEDTAAHTATSDSGMGFDTGSLAKGDSKTITFNETGTFDYICTFHPFMTGTVEVK